MKKVKKIVCAIVFCLFASTATGFAQDCNPAQYPEKIFSFPVPGQPGFLILNQQTLQNPTNLAPQARAWMQNNWLQIADQYRGTYEIFEVLRDPAGRACAVFVDVPNAPARTQDPFAPQPAVPQERSKPTLKTKIISGLINFGPLALGVLVDPWAGLITEVGLKIAGPKLEPVIFGDDGRTGTERQKAAKLAKPKPDSFKTSYEDVLDAYENALNQGVNREGNQN